MELEKRDRESPAWSCLLLLVRGTDPQGRSNLDTGGPHRSHSQRLTHTVVITTLEHERSEREGGLTEGRREAVRGATGATSIIWPA